MSRSSKRRTRRSPRPRRLEGRLAERSLRKRNFARHLSRRRNTTAARLTLSTSAPPRKRAAHWNLDPVTTAPVLLCIAMGLLLVGLPARLGRQWGDSLSTQAAITTGTFLAILVGLGAPRGLARWIWNLSWQKFIATGRREDLADGSPCRRGDEQASHAAVLGVVSLVAGASIALTPLLAGLADAGYQWFGVHFFWSGRSSVPLVVMLAFLVALVPVASVGMGLVSVHRLSLLSGGAEHKTMGRAYLGLVIGVFAALAMLSWSGSAKLLMMTAALPALVVAIITMTFETNAKCGESPAGSNSVQWLPTWSDHWPTLLRVGIVTAGLCGLWHVAAWTYFLGWAQTAPIGVLPVALLLAALGYALSGYINRPGPRSIGGFGVACAGAGCVAALSLVCAHRLEAEPPLRVAVTAAASVLVAIGFAVGYGQQVLLTRVSRFVPASVTTLAWITLLGGLLSWMVLPDALRRLGTSAGLALTPLMLFALGGILVIYEPSYSPRTRRVRLCGVFGGVAALILLAPQPAQPPDDGSRVVAFREVTGPTPGEPVSGSRADFDRLGLAR